MCVYDARGTCTYMIPYPMCACMTKKRSAFTHARRCRAGSIDTAVGTDYSSSHIASPEGLSQVCFLSSPLRSGGPDAWAFFVCAQKQNGLEAEAPGHSRTTL